MSKYKSQAHYPVPVARDVKYMHANPLYEKSVLMA